MMTSIPKILKKNTTKMILKITIVRIVIWRRVKLRKIYVSQRINNHRKN
jgi:hypothetical protein